MMALADLGRDLFSLVWGGLISGCLYAFGALGLVMVFKCSRVVNFSHGNAAGMAAFLVFGFSGGWFLSLSWGEAVLLALSASILIAVLSYAIIAPIVF